MRKIYRFFSIVLVSLVFAACGQGTAGNQGSTPSLSSVSGGEETVSGVALSEEEENIYPEESDEELNDEELDDEEPENEKKGDNEGVPESEESYNNPIDKYYKPIMTSSKVSEATRRWAQDTYRGVWRAEFNHLMKWLKNKCQYDEDKKNIDKMKKQVEKQIETEREVWEREIVDDYDINPDPEAAVKENGFSRMWGTGTRSALNELEGELYRDASMRIIRPHGGKKYKFRKIDYSEQSYE